MRNINEEFRMLVLHKFNQIKNAAIEKNTPALEKIIQHSFIFMTSLTPSKSPFSLYIDRHTPLSLLAFEGQDEAVDFLISQGGYFLEACIGYAASGNLTKSEALFATHEGTKKEWYLFCEKSSEFSVNEENLETILENNDYKLHMWNLGNQDMENLARVRGIAGALARTPMTQDSLNNKINKALGADSSLVMEPVLIENHFHGIGCSSRMQILDKKSFIEKFSAFYGPAFIGLARSCNLLLIKDLLQELSTYDQQQCAAHLVQGFIIAGYMYDPELVSYLNYALQSPSIPNWFSVKSNLFYDTHNIPKARFSEAIKPLVCLHKEYQTISLNHFQLQCLRHPETITWIWQSRQLVKDGIISIDIARHIFQFISELSKDESHALFDKIQFKYRKNFLLSDVSNYVNNPENIAFHFFESMATFFDSSYKKSRPNYVKAVSFLKDCQETSSLSKLNHVLANQYALFKPKTNNTIVKQEEADDYRLAIVRNYER